MPESSLKEKITESMKSAMRAKNKARLSAIRLAMSEIKKVEVDTRSEQSNAEIITILDKMVKQRRESIKQFKVADRQELVAQEEMEIQVLNEFLPQPLSEAELDSVIESAIAESGAETMQHMGKVMGIIKPQIIGKADMSLVSAKIKAVLT
jgi:uncharacterized protein YqeY